MNHKEN